MPTDHRAALAQIKRFDQLIAYLRDEMGWPIARESFAEVEDMFYDFTADELGIDPKTAAKIESIKRLKPLSPQQPWGIFFVKFEPKRLPVVALRRILSQVALKKRPSANSAERTAWAADDLLFVSNYGDGDERQISFAHFSRAARGDDLPTLKVLGWDNRDTALHLDAVARELREHLAWPEDASDAEAWRTRWRAAFTLGHREVVTTSKDLSLRLAQLARTIRERIRTALAIETDRGPLTRLMKAFQDALVHDLDASGFADMYAQTIAYGLLSARIVDPQTKTADDLAAHMRTSPFLRELMETFLKVGGRRGKAGGPGIDFDELGVSEVVELLDRANMAAVVRDFGDRNPQEDPVIHFYELFLREYDSAQRIQRGVYYTPRPVVSYIVRSVDQVLRSDFGLTDGLADVATWGEVSARVPSVAIPNGIDPSEPFVQVLDPATGTGTFLVEIIEVIHRTLTLKWTAEGRSLAERRKLWNSYVPRSLLPRLHGYELLMAPYAIAHLKVSLKLAETEYDFSSDERARVYLTNALEPPLERQLTLDFFPALAHEARAVDDVKRRRRFTVIAGNPPYSNFGRANDNPWIRGLIRDFWGALSGESKVNLYDDYIKFLRLAFHLRSGGGVVAFITNRSFLDGATQREMRAFLLRSVCATRILDLYRGIYDAARGRDENVFAIAAGVAVSIWSGKSSGDAAPDVRFGRLVGDYATKASALTESPPEGLLSVALQPRAPDYLLIPVTQSAPEYESAVPLPSLFRESTTGVQTNRDALCTDTSATVLFERIKEFASSPAAARRVADSCGLESTGFWSPEEASKELRRRGVSRDLVYEYLYRPFEKRFIYYDPAIVHCPRELVGRAVVGRGTLCVLASRGVDDSARGVVLVANIAADKRCINAARGEAKVFPVAWTDDSPSSGLLRGQRAINVMFPPTWPRAHAASPDREFLCAVYALLNSPTYRERHADSLRLDYPRVPIPRSQDLADELAALGSQLVSVHLQADQEFSQPAIEYVGRKNPRVDRVGWSADVVWLDLPARGRSEQVVKGTCGFSGVTQATWEAHVGGYRVCERFLKERKGEVLTAAAIAEFGRLVASVTESCRLQQHVDLAIERHGGWPDAFETSRTSQRVGPTRARRVAEGSNDADDDPGTAVRC